MAYLFERLPEVVEHPSAIWGLCALLGLAPLDETTTENIV